jgi:hypothetical protein
MYLLNSLILSSVRGPLTLDELASKIEMKQITAIFNIPDAESQILLNASRYASSELAHLHRALIVHPPEYYSVISVRQNKTRIFTNDFESRHMAYITVMTDIIEEITMLSDDQCTKYQLTKIDGLTQIPSAIIMKKNSPFYKALNFAATSTFFTIPNDDVDYN